MLDLRGASSYLFMFPSSMLRGGNVLEGPCFALAKTMPQGPCSISEVPHPITANSWPESWVEDLESRVQSLRLRARGSRVRFEGSLASETKLGFT